MTIHPSTRPPGLPRAGVDPVDSEESALAVVSWAVGTPARAETLVVLLDRQRCGIAIVSVDGTRDADDVLHVARHVLDPAVGHDLVAAAVIAPVRPGRRPEAGDADPAGDADRWLELDGIATDHGVTLLDWFVLDDRGVSRPRDLVAAPARWRPPRSTPPRSTPTP